MPLKKGLMVAKCEPGQLMGHEIETQQMGNSTQEKLPESFSGLFLYNEVLACFLNKGHRKFSNKKNQFIFLGQM